MNDELMPTSAAPGAFEARVLRSFFREGRAYPEREVNQRLALLHPDVAALRRHLVDVRLMTRESGEYRRG